MRLRLTLTTLAACLALSACGDAEPDEPAPVKGSGYTATAPDGWTDGSLLATYVQEPDLVLVEPGAEDASADALLVLREENRDFSADQIAETIEQLSTTDGERPQGPPTRSQIDGDEAVELVVKTKKGETRQRLEVSHGGFLYTILFTTKKPAPELFTAFRESWAWTE